MDKKQKYKQSQGEIVVNKERKRKKDMQTDRKLSKQENEHSIKKNRKRESGSEGRAK